MTKKISYQNSRIKKNDFQELRKHNPLRISMRPIIKKRRGD